MAMLSRLSYFGSKALDSIRESPGVSLLTSSTIATSLLVVGLFVMAMQTLESLTLVWGRSASVAAELRDEVPKDEWPRIRDALAALPNVAEASLVTPAEALERFRARSPEAAALVDGVSDSVLPAVVELRIGQGFADLAALVQLAEAASAVPGVRAVDYGQQELERLAALLDLLRGGGALFALVIGLATAFIVANTIRLTVYARREEITILRLVGATGWFVRAPFFIEGAVWGAAGGALAALALWLIDRVAAPAVTATVGHVVEGLTVRLFAPDIALVLFAAGVTLGALGSALAVRRFLEDAL